MAKKKKGEQTPEQITDSQTIADNLNKMDNGDPDFLTEGTRERVTGRPAGKTLVSGAGYHDFKTSPVYQGQYRRNVVREKDGDLAKNPPEKAGDLIGFIFEDEFGQETIISNSFNILKALEAIKYDTKTTLWIEFQGKVAGKGGRMVNRFHVQTVE